MKKFLIPLLLAIGLLPQLTQAQTHYVVPVGDAQTTNSFVPTYAYYGNSFTQFIYHANQVGIDGVIDNLQFHVASGNVTRSLTIYMAETPHSSFSSSSDVVGQSYFQQVYSGSVNLVSGWVSITLDSTFTYQDTSDLIICVIDGTDSWVSSYPSFTGSNISSGYHSIYTYADDVTYSLANPPVDDLEASNFQPYIRLGITSTSSYCAQPSAVAFSGISGDHVNITWHENGSATQWEIIVSDTAVSDFTSITPDAVYDTNYTAYGLSGNTQYYVYVRAVCSATDYSVWSNGGSFRSACVGETSIPYSTGFEDLATGELPNCWLQVAQGSSSASVFPAVYVYSNNARNGNVYFEFESTSGETEIAALPQMSNISQLQLSFYASLMNHNFMLEVGVMEDTLFVPVDTVELTAGSGNDWHNSYYPYTVYFTNYTGSGDRIALRVTSSGSYTLMMDDFMVDNVPDCIAPSNPRVDVASVDYLTISWTENGTASSWVIEYDTVPIADSLLGINIANTEYASSTTATLSNLDTGTTYYIYIYADCGSFSEACSLSANTLSALPAELPFSCDFEQSGSNGWELINGSQTNQWHVGTATSNGGSQSLYISNDNGNSNSYTTSTISYTYATRAIVVEDTGVYSYSYDWKCQGESHYYDFARAFIVPLTYSFTAGSNPAGTTYSFANWAAPSDWIEITENSSSPRTMAVSNTWHTVIGEAFISTPGVYNIVFAWANDGGGGSNPPMAVDNVIFAQNTCPSPQNLTATYVANDTVVLEWQPGESESSWIVTDGNGYSETVYDTTFLFENLLAATNYNFTVYALCDNGDTSMPATLSLRTPCGEWGPLPFNEDFNSYSSNSYPDCWTRILNSSNYPYVTSSYGVSIQSGGSASIITPRMPAPLNTLFVEFDLQREGPSSGSMEFGYTYSPNSIDSMVVIATITPANTYQMYHYEYDLSSLDCEDSVYLVWHQVSTSTVWYYWLDNVSVTRASTCPAIENLRCSSHTNHEATIVWTDTSTTHNDVMLYIATTNNIAMAFDSVMVSVGSTNHTFTGLNGNTHYYVWAKANCSDASSRYILCEFTTDVNCAPVENLRVVATDYHAFGLNWEAPTAGDPVTNYIVSYRLSGESSWISDTISDLYYYISGLDTNHTYQYRVTTICDTMTSAVTSGTVTTMGCARTITGGGTTNSYLPTYIFYKYSYTQQIYLDAEIGTGLDTITAISFYASSSVSSRNIDLYLGNTDQSSFSSTSNYIPADSLSLVYTGTFSGSGWITLNFTTPFVRTAGRNLVVAMDDNTGSYVSSISFAATSASNRSIYFYQDGSDIDPASPSASSYSVVSYVNQIKLNPATCHIPECNTPVVMIAGTEGTQVDLVWNNEPGRTYTVEYLRENTTNWVVVDSTNTTGACSVTGLLSGYSYTFRVSFDCDGDLLSGTAQSRAVCAPVALPYTEDFENQSGLYSRNCWYTGSTNLGSTYPNPIVVNLTGDPNKLLLLYNGAYIIMPEMDAPLNQLQIRFNFVQGGNNVRLVMGIMDDPTAPISTIRPIDTLIRSNMDTTSAYVYVTYPLDGIEDTTGHITFWDAFNDNYSFLDNIVVEYIPNCSNVTEIAASSVTSSSAVVSWANVASATSYIVEYGPRGFVPGTGTRVNVSTTSANLTGLAHSTTYEVYVYSVCGATNDTSVALQNARFTTSCDVLYTFPYVQNFENVVDPGDASTNIVPNCWASALLPDGAGHEVPHVFYNTDLGHAPSQQYCFYFEGIGIAALPEMGVSLDSLYIRFHEWNSDPSAYGLIIGAVDNIDSGFASTFVPIDTIPFNLEGNGNEFNVVSFLNGYTGTARHIAIASYNSNGSAYADQYLDNLVIDYIPSCIAPMRVHTTALTNVSADLAWTFSNAPNYSIEYGVHGFTPGTGTTVTSTTNSVSLTGLSAFTQYDVYLVSLCSATETSDTTFFTFTTRRAAPVTSYPYICTFADSTEANAWEPVNGSQINKWYVGTAAYYGTADNMGLYISNNNGVSNAYTNTTSSFTYAYRTFTMNVGSYNIGFNWKANGESNWDYIRAWLAPADFEFTPGQTPDGGTASYNYTNSNPAGWIPLDGGSKLNLESSWMTRNEDVTITTAGSYNLVFMWANDGSSGSNPPAAIDNVEVYVNTCPAPVAIVASSIGTTTLDVDWVDLGTPLSWQLEYGPQGFSRGTGTLMNVVSHPVHIYGLDTLTAYDFYVRPICADGDTGRWSSPSTIATALCDNATAFTIGGSNSPSTNYYAPVNNYYRYTLTETIIDSAELAGPLDIEYIAYYYDYSSPMTDKTNCTIYFQPTTKTVFTSSSDAVALDSLTAVKVFEGSLNCSQGWNYFQLDTVYSYNGTGNLMIIVDDNSNDYNSSYHVFRSEPCTGNKTLYYYDDSDNPDVNNPSSFSGSTETANWRTAMQLLSCGSAGCRTPMVTSVAQTYHSATISWMGDGSNYQVNIKESAAADWPATDIDVTTNSYTFTGLQPATFYTFRVRQDCSADSLGFSNWYTDSFVTDSLPCLVPDSLHTTAVTNATATFDWTVIGNETSWDIHVWFTGGLDSIYRVSTRPATVGGFTAGITYNASIRPLCGVDLLEGDWSDTVTFTTATCPDVTGLTASNVTTNSVTLNWTADPMAQSWTIEYGFEGFNQGTGTTVLANTNSYVVTGLLDDTPYEFYVKANCGTDWSSENWVRVLATTQSGGVTCDAPTGVNATVADNAVTVNWTANTGNISFEIEYGPRGFSHGAGTTTNATTAPAVISNLDYETQYDLYVRAICDQNTYSAYSNVVTFTTGQRPSEDCEPVSNLTVTEITDNTAHVAWTPAEGTDTWQIVVTDAQGADVADEVRTESFYDLAGLTAGKDYTVKVRTVCGDDNFSAYVSTNFRTTGGVGISDVNTVSCTIYPNPTTRSTTISVSGVNGKVKIEVVDMNGRVVSSESLECSSDCVKTMDVDNLAQGAYFVRITADNTNMVRKLIVR